MNKIVNKMIDKDKDEDLIITYKDNQDIKN